MNDLPHLTLEAREDSQLPDGERILRIRAERWSHYHLAETALVRMSELLAYPQKRSYAMSAVVWSNRHGQDEDPTKVPARPSHDFR
jgi:hypothetical protein